jgi:hypothetical protein
MLSQDLTALNFLGYSQLTTIQLVGSTQKSCEVKSHPGLPTARPQHPGCVNPTLSDRTFLL